MDKKVNKHLQEYDRLYNKLAFLVLLLYTFNGYAQRDYYFRDSTIYPINNSLSLIAGKRTLYKNLNGVVSQLKDFSIPNDTTFYIRDVDFVTANKGYVLVGSIYIGNHTQLYKTLDGGVSWELDTSFFPESERKSINQMQILDPNTFVLFDGYYTSSLIRSFDGGQTWTKWFESLIAHYFQMHRCSSGKWYLIGVPGDGFSSYSFPIPDSLWNKDSTYFMSGCHNSAPGCIRVFRDGDRDRATDFIAKQIDTLTKVCGKATSLTSVFTSTPIMGYPNPVTDIFTIENAENTFFQLYDLRGQRLLSGSIDSNKYQLSLSNLPDGIYLVLVGQQRFRIAKIP